MSIIDRMQLITGCKIVDEIVKTIPDHPITKQMGFLFREDKNDRFCDIALYPEVELATGFYNVQEGSVYYLINLPTSQGVQRLKISRKVIPWDGALQVGGWGPTLEYMFYPAEKFIQYIKEHS